MKRLLAGIALVLLLSFSLINVVSAAAPTVNTDPFAQSCTGSGANSVLCQEAGKSQKPEGNSLYGTNGIISKATSLVTLVVGVASVVAIIIGGVRYVLSSGDPANVNGAKNMIIYAIVGLIVALTAQGIVIFVINRI